jgi:hypothetical protein
MADNSDGTAKRKRGQGRPFQRGVSGNPGGRPVSDLDAFVRSHTGGGSELAEILLDIARGKAIVDVPTKDGFVTINPVFKDRISAIGELRQMGRFPVSPVDLNVAGGLKRDDLSQYTAEELRNFLKRLQESRCQTPKSDGLPVEKATP